MNQNIWLYTYSKFTWQKFHLNASKSSILCWKTCGSRQYPSEALTELCSTHSLNFSVPGSSLSWWMQFAVTLTYCGNSNLNKSYTPITYVNLNGIQNARQIIELYPRIYVIDGPTITGLHVCSVAAMRRALNEETDPISQGIGHCKLMHFQITVKSQHNVTNTGYVVHLNNNMPAMYILLHRMQLHHTSALLSRCWQPIPIVNPVYSVVHRLWLKARWMMSCWNKQHVTNLCL